VSPCDSQLCHFCAHPHTLCCTMPLSSKTWGISMAAATASIAVIGAWYGAGLKETREIKQVRQLLPTTSLPFPLPFPLPSFYTAANAIYNPQKAEARKQATPAERIALLEQTRMGLVSRRTTLEDKIAQLEARSEGREERRVDRGRSF